MNIVTVRSRLSIWTSGILVPRVLCFILLNYALVSRS